MITFVTVAPGSGPRNQHQSTLTVNLTSEVRAASLAISHYVGMVLHRGLCLRMALSPFWRARFFLANREGLAGRNSSLRRLWRAINAFGKVGKGYSRKRMLKRYERTRNVYENKENSDKMPGKKSYIYV